MMTIVLRRGEIAFIDDEDFKWLIDWTWYKDSHGYAVRYLTRGEINKDTPNKSHIKMHRAILNTPRGVLTDHIDGNRLNNQKSNLRMVNHQENSMNRAKGSNNKSGYRGVSWDNYNQKWKAQAMKDGKQKFLGNFDDPISAAKCRDAFVKTTYGSFGKLNFPPS